MMKLNNRRKQNEKNPAGYYELTVNDSPHPHASLILGFLNANFALQRK